jgi:CheY-like chemotaxis protein
MTRVLIVDDDADQVELRQWILEAEGFAVTVARSASDALNSLSKSLPDLMLMDLRLPEASDGLRLIRETRDSHRPLKILVLSGSTFELTRSAEAKLVDEVLQKPVRSEKLVSVLRNMAAG